jgi:uncharacterized Zn finger protein (UPF0148 family)
MNCGRCGRPIFKAGEVICDFCRKTFVKDATKHAARMNRKKEQEEDLFMNISSPGQDEGDVKTEMRHEHFVDTHDASSVWVDDGAGKKGGSKKRL